MHEVAGRRSQVAERGTFGSGYRIKPKLSKYAVAIVNL